MTMMSLIEEFKRRAKREQLSGNTGAAVAYTEAAIALKRELEKIVGVPAEDDFGFV